MKKIIKSILDEFEHLVSPKITIEFTKWVNACATFDKDSKRLLICLALEVENKLADKSCFVKIFNKIDYKSHYKPQLKFENVVNLSNPDLHFYSDEKLDRGEKTLCGLVKLTTFGQHYLDKNYKDDEMDFLKEELKNGDFESVTIKENTSSKPRETSWVTDHEEIEKLEAHADSKSINKANLLCNKLGLYWPHMGTSHDTNPEWVKLVYPKDMDFDFHQPLCVNADWKTEDGQFLSYKKNNKMGRTRSGTKFKSYIGLQESVHFRIGEPYTYGAFYIGQTHFLKRDTKTMINSAIYRYYDR